MPQNYIDLKVNLKEEQENREISPKLDLRFKVYVDTFYAEKCWVRPIFASDYVDMIDCFTDPESMKYFGPGKIMSIPKIQAFLLEDSISHCQKETTGWSIMTHDGIAGCFWVRKGKAVVKEESKSKEESKISEEFKNRKEAVMKAEIGYALRPQFAGRGLTTDAGKLILFSNFRYPKFKGIIFATAHPNNKASQAVLKKLGLEPDPERQNVPRYGQVRNYYQYSTMKKKSP